MQDIMKCRNPISMERVQIPSLPQFAFVFVLSLFESSPLKSFWVSANLVFQVVQHHLQPAVQDQARKV